MFTVDDPTVRRALARAQTSTPRVPKTDIWANIGKRVNSTPASKYWSTFTKLAPGHFKSDDMMAVRTEMLRDGTCPHVTLSGTGILK